MKRNLFLLFFLIIVMKLMAQEIMDEYWTHTNFSFGWTFSNDGHVSGVGSLDITLIDAFHDVYNFSYDSDEDSGFTYGYDFYLSFPVFLKKYFSTGIFTQALLQHTGATYFDGGMYAECAIKQFSLRAGVGLSGIYVSKNLGNLVVAWAGDPGFYTGNKFIKPGSSLNGVTTEFLGLTFNAALKYYPFSKRQGGVLKYTHLKIGYYYFQGKEITNYRLVLSGVDVKTDKQLPIFNIDSINTSYIGIGFGL